MKFILLISVLLSGFGLNAQKIVPKSPPKKKTLDEVYKGKHTLVSAKRDKKFGWEVTLKLSSDVKDDSIGVFEVLRTDSTVYYASILYPNSETIAKGQVLKQFMEISGDSIAPTDRFAPLGTYKDFYPDDAISEAKASIVFLDATVPNSTITGYLITDLEVLKGRFTVGDKIELVDNLGRKCIGKIEVLELVCDALGANNDVSIQSAIPSTFKAEKFKVVMIYSKLSGVDVGEKIKINKIN
jgi:hypothetical protein